MKSKYQKNHFPPGTSDFGPGKNAIGARSKRDKISPTSLFILSGRNKENPVDKPGEIKVLKSIVPKNGLRGLL